jgi:FixJ family two-component response regulator
MDPSTRLDPVLVVDDEEVVRATLEAVLEAEGYTVVAVKNAEQALEVLETRQCLMVITDVMMPGIDGMELLRRIRVRRPTLPVLVITGFPTVERAVEAVRAGAMSFITKPFDITEVLDSVERAARASVALRRNVETQNHIVNSVTMAIPSTVEHVTGAVHFLCERTLLTDLYSDATRFQVRLALTEAMANALKHGNHGDATKHIYLTATVDATRFDVTITDEGPGFDVHDVADPLADDVLASLRECGRGLFLIRCYMDGVEHNPSGNAIHLWKLRG